MSSICGVVCFKGDASEQLEQTASRMSATMAHRGPDASGIYVGNQMAFAHNQLQIIDLQTGAQPMHDETQMLTVVYDGAIYNFTKLRGELQAKGYTFRTNSDTEVLLNGFREWGADVAARLHGAFAYALWDGRDNTLHLARDRMGEKPLYYFSDSEKFNFSSEMKGILSILQHKPAINQDGLISYLSYKYIPEPITILENVFKLGKGQRLTIKDGDIAVNSYYTLREAWDSAPWIGDYRTCKKILREKVFQAVERQMISDVPIGALLSGGIDSSIVTGVMSEISGTNINTYSINYQDKAFDESYKSNRIAELHHTNHTSHVLEYDDVIDDIDTILLNYDEPYADSSAIAMYYVAKLAAKDVKVVLTGDGGDELFGGYNAYEKMFLLNRYNRMPAPVKNANAAIAAAMATVSGSGKLKGIAQRINALKNYTDSELWSAVRMTFPERELAGLVIDYQGNNYLRTKIGKHYDEIDRSPLSKMCYSDQCTELEGDMTTKVDRAAGLCALETRAPLMDMDLVEFSYRVPDRFKIRGSNKKRILKDAFADMLPKEIVEQKKQGFGVPVGSWLFRELRTDFLRLTSTEYIRQQGIFHEDAIKRIVNNHLGKEDFYVNEVFKPWTIYAFQKWYENIYLKL